MFVQSHLPHRKKVFDALAECFEKEHANKKFIPESPGTLRTDSGTFGAMTLAVIIIIIALSYLPALALGPLAEYFSLY